MLTPVTFLFILRALIWANIFALLGHTVRVIVRIDLDRLGSYAHPVPAR